MSDERMDYEYHNDTTEAGGTDRYYSWGQPEPPRPAAPASGGVTRARSSKNKRRLGAVLAVILVFILGAGAGVYMSGRTATADLSGAEVTGNRGTGRVETQKAGSGEEKSEPSKPESPDGGASSGAGETDSGTVSTAKKTISRVEDLADEDLSDTTVADVAERVMPSIVSVYNKYTEQGLFFGRSYTQEAEAAGSGIIIEETEDELLIVTNNHVVEGADSLSVQFIDEENCEASLKGTDASSDLAVIAVALSSLSDDTREKIAIAELGDSDSLRIGDHAIAIGNALGYGQSLTVGYVSALNREMTSENGITGTFIQTDAAINPGNSGGALLNSAGQVIGINSNKIGGSSIEGMGFAIPISKAIPIIEELKQQESRTKVAEEEQGIIGIHGITVTSDVASAYGLPVGAYVEEIIEGSGAANSDLAEGDIITGVNGQTITSMEELSNQLSYYAAGTEITLTVQHPLEGNEYEEKEIKVTLSKKSDVQTSGGYGRQPEQQGGPSEDNGDFDNFFGFPFGSFGF
ncbi:MAG: trypsin-like peptidase domain-containing protein [Eubacteriales bacterium]|nr:trypsin-like peptidase domain-containing protein [Eubacteriales bacterium]